MNKRFTLLSSLIIYVIIFINIYQLQIFQHSLYLKTIGETEHEFITDDNLATTDEYQATNLCQCRQISIENMRLAQSTCSLHASSRGVGQKVISSSLYAINGHFDEAYLKGVNYNLETMRKYFPPGFVIRIYHDIDLTPKSKLCQIFCSNPDLDLCDVRSINNKNYSDTFGMTWRFLPMADDLVSEFHSRDLDSNITQRESEVVQDWRYNSNELYHMMRDNPFHNTAIMGGMFGMRINEKNSKILKQIVNDIMKKSKGVSHQNKGFDQEMLKEFLWPEAKNKCVYHDSYLCNYLEYGHRPFLSKRESSEDFKNASRPNFVGSNGGMITLDFHGKCPTQCRPKEHQDWILC